ncbi:MAG: hypothetical protein ACXVEE_09615 [Polyangiales bacterium]
MISLACATGCSSGDGGGQSVEEQDSAIDPVDTGTIDPGDTSSTTDTTVDDTTMAETSTTCGASGGTCAASADCCSGLQCIYGKCGTCNATYPDYCLRPGRTDGGCFPPGTACSTVTECAGSSARGCPSTLMKYDCTTKSCACADPKYPTYCKAHDGVPEACWSAGTVCSTTTQCTDGTLHSCLSPVVKYDCTTKACACPDPKYPNYCKAHDGVPEGCWPSTTACSTTTKCSDGTQHACRSSSFTYDCTTSTCKCADPKYPVYCPALGDVPANCWSTGTLCGSVANCSGTYHSCTSSGYHYDCTKSTCVADSTGGTGGSTSCDPASCKSFSNCVPGYGCMTCYQWCDGSVCHDGGCSDPF